MTAGHGGDLCLVTGASGFIGGHLVERLVGEGHRVRCLVRPTSDTALLTQLGVELVQGDVTSADSLPAAVRGASHVIHCAAMVSDWGTVEEIRRVNVGGTRSLLEAASAASVRRFVHVSTTDVYGYPGGRAVEETHPPGRFRNWYAQTKLEAESEVRRIGERAGLEHVILRPATVYGPRSEEVVGEIARAIRGGRMLLVDRGRAVAGLTYVANLADAAVLALAHRSAPGQAFNVTDGLQVTWRQFVDDLSDGLGCRRVRWSVSYGVAAALGVSLEVGYRLARTTTHLKTAPLLSRQAVQVLGRPQDFSNHKARRLLGWEPRVAYAAGLEATLAWLLSAAERPIRSPRAAAS
jgi:nucleoside-diphosphate-sugar epimerase